MLNNQSSEQVVLQRFHYIQLLKPTQFTHAFNSHFSGTSTRVSWYQKGKNQSGFYWGKRQWVTVEISWAICMSAPRSRQITTPAPHHSVFLQTGCLPAAQPTASKHWRRRHTRTHYTRATTFSFFCLISLLLWSYSALGRVARRKPMWVTKMGSHIRAVCCPGDRIKVLYGLHTRNGKTTDTHLGI